MSPTVETNLQRIAEWAVRYQKEGVRGLAHLIDVDLLREAYYLTNPKSAPGIDRETWHTYGQNLEENLRDLHQRMRDMRYLPQPVERVWIDKEDGKKRPIGIPVLEDKVAQRAVAMVLEPIYETVFYDFSYGFRPGRSAHQALHTLREQCFGSNVRWILDADVSGFFDNIDHQLLKDFVQQMVKDKNIIRLLHRWLRSGVLEKGQVQHPDRGTPQGGVISPLMANVFLHYVLDDWFVRVVRPRMKGRCFLVRFADDFVIGFELEEDARKVMEVLPKRFARFKLTIHPQKTKLVKFGRPSRETKASGNDTFDFLGFTHYWAKSLRGNWVVKRRTARKRRSRAMTRLWQWCRRNRHLPIPEQYEKLSQKLKGHYGYYGIRGNIRSMAGVYEHARRTWHYWLSRRSSKGIPWEKFKMFLEEWSLPRPRIIHSI